MAKSGRKLGNNNKESHRTPNVLRWIRTRQVGGYKSQRTSILQPLSKRQCSDSGHKLETKDALGITEVQILFRNTYLFVCLLRLCLNKPGWAKDNLELFILAPLSQWFYYRSVWPCLVCALLGTELKALCILDKHRLSHTSSPRGTILSGKWTYLRKLRKVVFSQMN